MMKQKKSDDVLEELEFQEKELWRLERKKTEKERTAASDEEYQRTYSEILDKKQTIKYLREEDGKKITVLIGFHDFVNMIGSSIYRFLRPPKLEVSAEEARQNLHEFIMENVKPDEEGRGPCLDTFTRYQRNGEKRPQQPSLEEKLKSLGVFYLQYEQIVNADPEMLWPLALQYDGKGIIANPKETLPELIYRGNSLLYLGQHHQEGGSKLDIKIESDWTVQPVTGRDYKGIVAKRDVQEALKRVPYYMDLSWFPAYVKDGFIVPAGAVTFTLPHYNGLGFIQVLPSYKSRDKFLEILSHELVHAGTVYLDSRRDYLETKAYHVGRGSLIGEYMVAVNQRPNLLMRGIEWGWNVFFPWLPLPNRFVKFFPKAKAVLQILATTGTFRDVEQKLTTLYGKKGNYILGRLTGDEIEEFHYTNDIPARIAMKDSLKWQIMKTNVETLE